MEIVEEATRAMMKNDPSRNDEVALLVDFGSVERSDWASQADARRAGVVISIGLANANPTRADQRIDLEAASDTMESLHKYRHHRAQ